MRLLCLSLMLLSAFAFCSTYMTVEDPVDPDKHAYLRKVRYGEGDERWFLLFPNVVGFQVHPVSSVEFGLGVVMLISELYGSLSLKILQNGGQNDLRFHFCKPDPFGLE